MQDAYYDEELGAVIDDMFLQVHMLGGGYAYYITLDRFYFLQMFQASPKLFWKTFCLEFNMQIKALG